MSAPALRAYRLMLGLAEPLAPLILKRRLAKGKEDGPRLGERLGRTNLIRSPGPLVWLHGVSVGESLSLLPLIERLRGERPGLTLLVTSGTQTSAALLARRLPQGVIHQYAPVDAPGAVARFLVHWRPDLGVFAEGDIWPNLLMAAKARGVKLALVSARITEKTARGWSVFPASAALAFGAFDIALPQDEESARRLQDLGANVTGRLNLKLAGDPLPADPAALKALKSAVAGRPVLLAASTHGGDEPLALDAYAQADPDRKSLLVIVPRHAERGPTLAETARARGLTATLRSAGEAPASGQVHVADTLGELGLWFRVAAATYMGGGLTERIGGHNPLEAARLDCPVISGPRVSNWAEVYAALGDVGGVTVIETAADLAAAFARALTDPAAMKAQAARARALADGQAAAMDAGWAALKPLLPA